MDDLGVCLPCRAEADAEADSSAQTVQPGRRSARVVSHLPRLDTHTLTVGILSGGEPPSLQTSVEQLLHLIRHLKEEVGGQAALQHTGSALIGFSRTCAHPHC